MPELNQFRHLVAVADPGTLSKAAELVHLSQPALTRSIQRLEAEWNVTLFDRQKNKITLNKTGELAVQCARRVLEDVDFRRSLDLFCNYCLSADAENDRLRPVYPPAAPSPHISLTIPAYWYNTAYSGQVLPSEPSPHRSAQNRTGQNWP